MINSQLYLFLIFAVDGIIIGFLFDFFRILRKAVKTPDVITYIEDILFWILTGLLILYSIFTYNNGEIRLFMFLAIVLGILLYVIILSKFVIKLNLIIIDFIKKIFSLIFKFIRILLDIFSQILKHILFKPISFIIINIKKFFTKIGKNFIISIKKSKISTKFVKNAKN